MEITREAKRRNFLVLSVVLIIFSLGGGTVEQLFWVQLKNEWVAVAVLIILFLIAFWRYDVSERFNQNQFLRRWFNDLYQDESMQKLIRRWTCEMIYDVFGSSPTYEKKTSGQHSKRRVLLHPKENFIQSITPLTDSGSYISCTVFTLPIESTEGEESGQMWTIQLPHSSATDYEQAVFWKAMRKHRVANRIRGTEYFDLIVPYCAGAFALGTALGSVIAPYLLSIIYQ